MNLLGLLSDGMCHSGEKLGAALGISRAAVWKQLQGLRADGADIEAVPGKGYRLVRTIEPWNRDALLSVIGREAKLALEELLIERRVSSTNDVVSSRMALSSGNGVIACLADEQIRGRGRRGRQWLSPFSGNFYGTVGIKFKEGVRVAGGLSLAVGVVLARALQQAGIEGVQLKWPNDIEVCGAKLGGILIELQAEANGPCGIIVGVGLNMRLPDVASASVSLGRAVTDIATCINEPFDRNLFGGHILRSLIILLMDYPSCGFAAFREEWLKYDALIGQEVVVSGVEPSITGIARGVDTTGALLIETVHGTVAVHSGEVSVRKLQA